MIKSGITTGGLIRLVIYAIGALVGLAALVAGILGHVELGALLGTIAGGAAAITGGTATFNLEKAPDQKTPVDIREILPAFLEISKAAKDYSEHEPGSTPLSSTKVEEKPKHNPVPDSANEGGKSPTAGAKPKPEKPTGTGNQLLADLRERIAQNRN